MGKAFIFWSVKNNKCCALWRLHGQRTSSTHGLVRSPYLASLCTLQLGFSLCASSRESLSPSFLWTPEIAGVWKELEKDFVWAVYGFLGYDFMWKHVNHWRELNPNVLLLIAPQLWASWGYNRKTLKDQQFPLEHFQIEPFQRDISHSYRRCYKSTQKAPKVTIILPTSKISAEKRWTKIPWSCGYP